MNTEVERVVSRIGIYAASVTFGLAVGVATAQDEVDILQSQGDLELNEDGRLVQDDETYPNDSFMILTGTMIELESGLPHRAPQASKPEFPTPQAE